MFIVLALIFWGPKSSSIIAVLSGDEENGELEKLKLENDRLRAKLAALETVEKDFFPQEIRGVRAFVYSRYFFNLRDVLVVNKGADDGLRLGQAVVLGGQKDDAANYRTAPVLIGRIKEVFKDHAVFETIYDPRWQSAVRIGETGIDALLIGGNEPKAALIPKGVSLDIGAPVYSASPEFPYGLAVGRVKSIRESADGLFKEAVIEFPYDIQRIRTVLILDYATENRR